MGIDKEEARARTRSRVRPMLTCCVLCAAAWLAATSRVAGQQARGEDATDRISARYLKDADLTELTLTLTPTRHDRTRPPFRLILSASHQGKIVRHAPAAVRVNAQPHPLAVVPALTFVFTLDETSSIDLAAPGRSFRYTYPCDDCGATGIVAEATFDEIRRIASAASVTANVLGFSVELDAGNLAALRRFVARLTPEPERPVPPRIVPPVMDGRPDGPRRNH